MEILFGIFVFIIGIFVAIAPLFIWKWVKATKNEVTRLNTNLIVLIRAVQRIEKQLGEGEQIEEEIQEQEQQEG